MAGNAAATDPGAARLSSINLQLVAVQSLVVLVVMAAVVIGLLNVRTTGRRVKDIEDVALRSMELLGQLRSSAVEQNLLALNMSLQGSPDLPALHQSLAALRERTQTASARYHALPTYPGEQEGWARLEKLLQQDQAALERFLVSLGGTDRAEIQAGRAELLAIVLKLEQATEELTEINRLSAEHSVQEVQRLHRRTIDALLLSLVGLILLAELVMARAERKLHHQAQLIERQLCDLQALLAGREDLLASTAHELKTPIAALLLLAERLNRQVPHDQDPGLGPLVARLRQQSHRVARMLDRLLDLAALSEGKLELHYERVDGAELAQQVVDDLGALRESLGSTVSVEITGEVSGDWDRLRLERALAGLLSNALKYGEGGPVQVRVGAEAGLARFEVQDHGLGIAPEDQARIFERFGRIAPGHHQVWGLGLGLWSVRAVVEAHGGKVLVRSRPQQGSTFTILLPLAPSPAPLAPGEPPAAPPPC